MMVKNNESFFDTTYLRVIGEVRNDKITAATSIHIVKVAGLHQISKAENGCKDLLYIKKQVELSFKALYYQHTVSNS
jgi:hypothetical protein